MEAYQKVVNQAIEMVNRWKILCRTPVVDDDFIEMKERFELELQRLKHIIKEENV